MNKRIGFTLIGLLIVVAIIVILATISVPIFLNAQFRAIVARVQADHKTLSNSIEMYRLDFGMPPKSNFNAGIALYDSGKCNKGFAIKTEYLEMFDNSICFLSRISYILKV